MITQLSLIKRISLLSITLLMVIFAFVQLRTFVFADLTSGFSHPLEGWDHIVTMLGVGIWAAQLRGKAIWLLPLTFVSVMSLGGISGAAQYLAVPSAEILIFLSCLVFSALILRKIHFDTKINVLIVAFFAFFHGYAHGQEISTSVSLLSYTVGFMTATLLLHGAGILVTKVILLSITFFIAQLLNFVAPTHTIKTSTPSYSQFTQNDLQPLETQSIEKPPLISSTPQWQHLSPPIISILKCVIAVETYFVSCVLLLVFYISQFICYVFYVKQRPNFVFLFKIPRLLFQFFYTSPSTLSRSNQFSIFNLNSKGIFMSIRLFKIFTLFFFLLPSFAHAHSMAFVAADWSSGFLHPFQGADHIVAMLAVGFWAAQLRGGAAIWLLPLIFVSIMALGGLLGAFGFSFDYAETIILLSGFVLSILAIRNVQFDLKITALIVGFFALFHGVTHGAEIASSADLLFYSIGFVTATLLLHLVGILIAQRISSFRLSRLNNSL